MSGAERRFPAVNQRCDDEPNFTFNKRLHLKTDGCPFVPFLDYSGTFKVERNPFWDDGPVRYTGNWISLLPSYNFLLTVRAMFSQTSYESLASWSKVKSYVTVQTFSFFCVCDFLNIFWFSNGTIVGHLKVFQLSLLQAVVFATHISTPER